MIKWVSKMQRETKWVQSKFEKNGKPWIAIGNCLAYVHSARTAHSHSLPPLTDVVKWERETRENGEMCEGKCRILFHFSTFCFLAWQGTLLWENRRSHRINRRVFTWVEPLGEKHDCVIDLLIIVLRAIRRICCCEIWWLSKSYWEKNDVVL